MSTDASKRTDVPFDPREIPNALTQIARLGEGVKTEFDLIAGRMTWLTRPEAVTGRCRCWRGGVMSC